MAPCTTITQGATFSPSLSSAIVPITPTPVRTRAVVTGTNTGDSSWHPMTTGVGNLPLDSRQPVEPGGASTSSTLTLPVANKNTSKKSQRITHTPSQSVDSNAMLDRGHAVRDDTLLSDREEDSNLADAYCDDPGSTIDDNSNGSVSDSEILPRVSTPVEGDQSRHLIELDSSEDFRESPLPETPRRALPKRAATLQNGAKKADSGIAATKRGRSSKESYLRTAPLRKKVIITRSMTSSRGAERSMEGAARTSTRPVEQFDSDRSTPSTRARSAVNRGHNYPPTRTASNATTPVSTTQPTVVSTCEPPSKAVVEKNMSSSLTATNKWSKGRWKTIEERFADEDGSDDDDVQASSSSETATSSEHGCSQNAVNTEGLCIRIITECISPF